MTRPLFPEVVVDGRVIPPAAIAAEAQNHTAPTSKPGWAWRKAARALTVKALLLQEAERRGLAPDPIEIAPGKIETDEEALIRDLLDRAITPAKPDTAAARRFYAQDPTRFRAPTLYEASHILFAAPMGDAAARAKAMAFAKAAVDALRAHPGDFERIAREESACPSREAGGRLGQFCAGDMAPAFEAALDAAEEGVVAADPVETVHGVHVVRLDARAAGATPPFKAVEPRIREALEKAAWAHAARDFVAALASRARIEGVEFEAALG